MAVIGPVQYILTLMPATWVSIAEELLHKVTIIVILAFLSAA